MYLTNSDLRSSIAEDHSDHFTGDAGLDRNSDGRHIPLVFDNEILRSLGPEILDELGPLVRRVRVTKDDFLFQQDDEVNSIYFPETAILSEFHLLEDGRMVEVAMTGRDGVVGVSSIFCYEAVPNCVQVIQSGTVLLIESVHLKRIVARHPELVATLFGTLEVYIRQLSQKVVCNMYHSLESRLCTWLLRFTDRSERDVLKLTHEQLARVLGVYRPSVTCIALAMKERAVINYSRGGLSITNRPELEHLACGCYVESESQAPYRRASSRGFQLSPA